MKNKIYGISNIMAAILLIITVIVVSGLFYSFSREMFRTLSTTVDFEISDASLYIDSTGNPTLVVTCKNIGNVGITLTSIALGSWSQQWNQTIDPGQVTGKSFTPIGEFKIGSKYVLRIAAISNNGGIVVEKAVIIVAQ
ncbi:MAG: hypothetical protein QXV10_05680 [Nitrososphaerota archaeon]